MPAMGLKLLLEHLGKRARGEDAPTHVALLLVFAITGAQLVMAVAGAQSMTILAKISLRTRCAISSLLSVDTGLTFNIAAPCSSRKYLRRRFVVLEPEEQLPLGEPILRTSSEATLMKVGALLVPFLVLRDRWLTRLTKQSHPRSPAFTSSSQTFRSPS